MIKHSIRFILVHFVVLILNSTSIYAQNSHADKPQRYLDVAKKIIEASLSKGEAYSMLAELTLDIGPRLSGSLQAAAAVEWGRQTMLKYELENVHLQDVMVPHWIRGPVEKAAVINSPTVGTVSLAVCALGRSVGTPELGIAGEVIEVHNFEEVKALSAKAKGKIIFYNRAMDPTKMSTFSAYGGAMRYDEAVPEIPAAAISTVDANFLSQLIQKDGKVRVHLKLSCETLPDVLSANVIGEIKGSEKPDEVIVIGGHLDSWDKGHGAHDDGAGCVQSIEALRLIKSLGLKPKRTIRAVLFMNEENGMRGGLTYADNVEKYGPTHIAAIESDRGGFMPEGFTVKADNHTVHKISNWAYLLEPMNADDIRPGGGVDIGPLNRKFGIPTIGLSVESQRYFDYHHSDNDTFDKVNERELALGAAAMAILAYVLAMEGV